MQHKVQAFTIYSYIHIEIKQTMVMKVNKATSEYVDDFPSIIRIL